MLGIDLSLPSRPNNNAMHPITNVTQDSGEKLHATAPRDCSFIEQGTLSQRPSIVGSVSLKMDTTTGFPYMAADLDLKRANPGRTVGKESDRLK
jgi:hypothetical protein